MRMCYKDMSLLETEGEIKKDVHYIMRVYISSKIVKGKCSQSVFIVTYLLLHFEKDEGVLYRDTRPLGEKEVQDVFKNVKYKVVNNMIQIPIYSWKEESDSSKDVIQAMQEKDLIIRSFHKHYNTSEVKRNANETMQGVWIRKLSSGNLYELEELIQNVIVRTKLVA